jgi:hypothetical protein
LGEQNPDVALLHPGYTLRADDLLAPSVRALGAFMSASKPPKKVCDLTAKSGVQTR